MAYQIIEISNLADRSQPLYAEFRSLHAELFGEEYTQGLEIELDRQPRCTLFIAKSEPGQVLGFKLGYELGRSEYYSWSGGVSPSARKQGIATALMNAQHEWCKRQGYKRVQTKTKNKWRDMLVLNIRSGFDIVGTYTDQFGEPKIILEKRLL